MFRHQRDFSPKKTQNQIKITQKLISNQNHCQTSDFKSKPKIIKMISNHDFKLIDFKSFRTLALVKIISLLDPSSN